MSRKKGREQVGVALFPFLAVLICTMGALIVLLVLLVQQARVDASVVAEAAIGGGSDADKQLRERREEAEWKRELLERSRLEKTQELADMRAQLAHVEEHAQRLAARAKELIAQAQAIDQGKTPADDLADARSEIQRLKKEIDRRLKELEDAKKKADGKESYALIPYEGSAGTRRRPIYVECTEFGVIVQPEGILLRSEDFTGPLGPGNPLDVTLRAIREHHERTLGPKAGQPYPLLVVRPGGILAYGAARAAMAAWDDEFGYELISDEKHLDFGEADPALANSLARTVAVARQRQAAMAAMMPRKYQDEAPPSYSSSSPAPEPRTSSAGGRFGPGAGSMGTGIGGEGTPGFAPSGASGGGAGSGGTDRFASSGSGTAGGIANSGASGMAWPGAQPAAGQTGSSPGGAAGGGTGTAGTTEAGAAGSAAATGDGTPGGSGMTAGTAAGQTSGGMGSAGGAMSASPMSAGQPTVTLPTFGQKSGANSKNGAGSSNVGSKAGGRGSSKTGKNWALPQAKPNAIGVTRPIRISVLPDRIVLAPERGDNRTAQAVPIAPELTPDDVTHFVDAVHREVDQWGLAVADGYWKPVLQAEVAPGCERHYENLRTALSGSGLDIIRR
jgi:hypothetical protein